MKRCLVQSGDDGDTVAEGSQLHKRPRLGEGPREALLLQRVRALDMAHLRRGVHAGMQHFTLLVLREGTRHWLPRAAALMGELVRRLSPFQKVPESRDHLEHTVDTYFLCRAELLLSTILAGAVPPDHADLSPETPTEAEEKAGVEKLRWRLPQVTPGQLHRLVQLGVHGFMMRAIADGCRALAVPTDIFAAPLLCMSSAGANLVPTEPDALRDFAMHHFRSGPLADFLFRPEVVRRIHHDWIARRLEGPARGAIRRKMLHTLRRRAAAAMAERVLRASQLVGRYFASAAATMCVHRPRQEHEKGSPTKYAVALPRPGRLLRDYLIAEWRSALKVKPTSSEVFIQRVFSKLPAAFSDPGATIPELRLLPGTETLHFCPARNRFEVQLLDADDTLLVADDFSERLDALLRARRLFTEQLGLPCEAAVGIIFQYSDHPQVHLTLDGPSPSSSATPLLQSLQEDFLVPV